MQLWLNIFQLYKHKRIPWRLNVETLVQIWTVWNRQITRFKQNSNGRQNDIKLNTGLLCGMTLAEMEQREIKIPRHLYILGWVASTLVVMSIFYVPWVVEWISGEAMDCSFAGAIHAGSCRTLWGLSISWIIIACANNSGSWVNLFLSNSIFRVLGPITFAMYLFTMLPKIQLFRTKVPLYHDLYESVCHPLSTG